MKDYYKILGVNPNATREEIKKRYIELSVKSALKNENPTMAEIIEAYKVLSDPEKREEYNRQYFSYIKETYSDSFNQHISTSSEFNTSSHDHSDSFNQHISTSSSENTFKPSDHKSFAPSNSNSKLYLHISTFLKKLSHNKHLRASFSEYRIIVFRALVFITFIPLQILSIHTFSKLFTNNTIPLFTQFLSIPALSKVVNIYNTLYHWGQEITNYIWHPPLSHYDFIRPSVEMWITITTFSLIIAHINYLIYYRSRTYLYEIYKAICVLNTYITVIIPLVIYTAFIIINKASPQITTFISKDLIKNSLIIIGISGVVATISTVKPQS